MTRHARGWSATLGRPAGGWVALTIGASLLVCAMVVALQMYQDRSLARATAIVRDLRLARIDLYQGVMHALLGDAPESPWEAGRGRVLIRQSLDEFRSSLARLPGGPASIELESQLQQFARAVEAVRRDEPRARLDLRVAFFRLNSAALQVDQDARNELAQLRQARSGVYGVVLAVAALLLAVISAAAVRLRLREAAAAAAQRASDLRFAVLFAQNPQPTLVHAQGRIELANPAALRALGATDEDAVRATPLLDLVAEPDRERIAQVLAGLEAGAPAAADAPKLLAMRRLDGSEFSVEAVPASFRAGDGVQMLWAFRDVTGRLAAERALQRSQAQLKESLALLEATLQSTDNGVLVVGPDGRLLLWNARLLELPGGRAGVEQATEAGALSALILQPVAPDHGAHLAVVARPDGTYLEAHWQPMRIDGRDAGRVWSFRDVTEREGALAHAHTREQELERRVQQRTADLAQAYADLQTFSDAVSHDLRTPLAAIDTFAETVLRRHGEQLPAQGRHYLERVVAGAATMKAMIHGLLELSRHARAPLHRQRLDLGRMARDTFELQAQSLPGRRVEFVLAPGDLACAGDPVLVATLLQNLIGNAIKYSRQRDPARIEVGARDVGVERQFYVRDNGAGFDPAYAGRLFLPFSRLHGADEFEGHGIGLATVARIVARHGGRIRAEGAEGEGATFWFTLGPCDGEDAPPGEDAPRGQEEGSGVIRTC